VSVTTAGDDMLLTIQGNTMTVSDINPQDIGIDSFILATADGMNPPTIDDYFLC
jgi:hypothetical protein